MTTIYFRNREDATIHQTRAPACAGSDAGLISEEVALAEPSRFCPECAPVVADDPAPEDPDAGDPALADDPAPSDEAPPTDS